MVLKDIIDITQLFDQTLFVKEQVKIVWESVSKIVVVLEYSFNPLRKGDERRKKSIFHSPEYSLLIYLELVLVLTRLSFRGTRNNFGYKYGQGPGGT